MCPEPRVCLVDCACVRVCVCACVCVCVCAHTHTPCPAKQDNDLWVMLGCLFATAGFMHMFKAWSEAAGRYLSQKFFAAGIVGGNGKKHPLAVPKQVGLAWPCVWRRCHEFAVAERHVAVRRAHHAPHDRADDQVARAECPVRVPCRHDVGRAVRVRACGAMSLTR